MDGSTRVALSGTNFTPMPAKTLKNKRQLLLPQITLTSPTALPGAATTPSPVTIKDDPANVSQSRVHWASETAMSFDVRPADMLPAGVFGVTVTNPDGTSAASLDQTLAIIPPPIVTQVMPPAICVDQSDQTLKVTGTNFLVYDGATPTVTLGSGSNQKTYTATVDPADCMAITGNFKEKNVALCTALSFTVPQGDFMVTGQTKLDLVVTNPAPADCASSSAVQVTLDPPPEVDAVQPSTVCEGGAQVTITGSNFISGATVTLDCDTAGTFTASSATVTPDGTQIAATFGGGLPAGQTCKVIVQNPDGCQDRPLPHKTVTVTSGPVVFDVDPDVVFNGINTRVTVFATSIQPPLPMNPVTITPTGKTSPVIPLTNPQIEANHPNRLQATVPSGTAAGVYDLTLTDNTGCSTILPMAITVTDQTTVTLKNVDPPFGHTGEDTAVTIFRDTTAAPPNNAPFVATPEVFLNPHNGSSSATAVPLKAVAFLSGDEVTGVVPASTATGLYDVILVNPDGTVGELDSGYTETANPPPEVDSATPASIVDASGQKVTLAGLNFGASDMVTLTCVDNSGNPEPAPTVSSTPASCSGPSCTQDITIDGSSLAIGSVCVVRVTNGDGTFGDFSAIGVTNSSFNLVKPKAGPDMNVGRRALSLVAGNATSANRFIYAIGGDDGTSTGALDSVEFAPVDIFGNIGAFTVAPTNLTATRTLAGAVTVGRYIYLVGGDDGNGPTDTAERALILSPQETPEISDLGVILGANGLDPGEYHYRVSAVYTQTAVNPGGESLASDEFTVKVPTFTGKKVAVTLVWKQPVDSQGNDIPVDGYRIYRTVKAGDAAGSEVLLGTTSGSTTTFTDDGSKTPGSDTPLPLGSTTDWEALPNLGSARSGLAVVAAPDPDPLVNAIYVYALLGADSSGALTSYEFLKITTAANGRQTPDAAWQGGATAATAAADARSQVGAWLVDSTVSSAYSAGTYVFIGGGVGSNHVDAGEVTTGGQLDFTTAVNTQTFPQLAGYGLAAANGQLFTFGGGSLGGGTPTPTAAAKSATLAATPPQLAPGAWNDEGLTMTHARYLMGSAIQSSFIFIAGGQTDEPSPASKTTELVIW